MIIKGAAVYLRPANMSDREKIYGWMACSDLTPSMMGPPHYSDNPIPSWEHFCEDYKPHFFNASGEGKGRVYIVIANGEEVGTVGYDLLDTRKKRVFLDIWLRSERHCGRGYGNDALTTLCNYLSETYGVATFLISPSARNKRAIAAYEKSGFCRLPLSKQEQEAEFGKGEYHDNIIMRKDIPSRSSG